MDILSLEEIKNRIELPTIIEMQKQGFIALHQGKVSLPPVGYLAQSHPPGSYHIKYGMIEKDSIWVIKIAGGPQGKPMSGMMIAFSTESGQPVAILQEDGYLTHLRTAVAGLIAASSLAPKNLQAIGIIGSGTQARMQLELLMQGTACRRAFIWGRSADKVRSFAQEMTKKGFFVSIANTPKELALKSQLIVTTTASHEPILQASDIQPGTHITAMGADAPGKQELDPHIMGLADVVVVDDKAQCIDHGEICTAVRQGLITEQSLIELGDILLTPSKGRQNDEQITVADLTGVAVQDIQIVKAILSAS